MTKKSLDRIDLAWKIVILATVAAAFAIPMALGRNPLLLDFEALSSASAGRLVMLLLPGVFFFAGLYFALRYRPYASLSDAELPRCTVIVPAYNEGAMVRVALLSAVRSIYPPEKLHVIAIDDGSKDDTWQHIQAVAAEYPGRITAIRQDRNRGKREALRRGFLLADGEAVITVDSDSALEPDAARELMAPIVRDPKVAAVAGRVLVLNREQSIFTRMLGARFGVAYDYDRAKQSRFGAVLCCSGVLAAYRRDAVLAVLEDWDRQTFLGVPCKIAEDRALTTWLLKTGNKSVYQSTARGRTLMPPTYKRMWKMLVRWERGNIRETLVLLRATLRGWRAHGGWWPVLELVAEVAYYPVALLSIVAMMHFVEHPLDVARLFATVTLAAFVQSLYCLRSERTWQFLYNIGYSLFSIFGLALLFPYSFLTVRNSGWLTR
jgi:hyaluronan synthase